MREELIVEQDVQKNKKKALFSRKLFLRIGAVVAVSSLLVGGGFLFFSRYEINERRVQVCGDDIVNKFNSVYDNYETYYKDREKVAEEIQGIPGYAKDPTCLYILQSTKGLDKVRYETIKELSNNGINPSVKLRNIQDIERLKPVNEQRVINSHRGEGAL